MSKLPAPKAIIFDWDNTLVNTWPVIHAALVATFRDMGHTPWTLEQTKQRVAKSMRDSFPELFGADWKKAGDIYQQHYRSIHLKSLQSLPQAEELLKSIRSKKLFCTVVSNKKGPTLRQEIEHLGWTNYFDSIVGSDDAARDKPYADPLLLAFDKSGLTPSPEAWFIGDSEVDLECAMATGCTAVLYGEEAKKHPEFSPMHFRGFPYHAFVLTHADTLALLEKL